MEGLFRHAWCVEPDGFKLRIDGIVTQQRASRICSLTKDHRSHLLWSHYAAVPDRRRPRRRSPSHRKRHGLGGGNSGRFG
jgi:hypothetical protein